MSKLNVKFEKIECCMVLKICIHLELADMAGGRKSLEKQPRKNWMRKSGKCDQRRMIPSAPNSTVPFFLITATCIRYYLRARVFR